MIVAMGEKRGRKHAFNDLENEVLLKTLDSYVKLNGLNSVSVAPMLGVGQQTANDYMRGKTRMGRPSAMKLVKHVGGYKSVEDFLEAEHGIVDGKRLELPTLKKEKGRTSGTKPSDEGEMAVGEHPERAMAAQHARALGVTDRAIENVIARFRGEPRHVSSWWATKFLNEQEFLNEQTLQRMAHEAEREAKSEAERDRRRSEKPRK